MTNFHIQIKSIFVVLLVAFFASSGSVQAQTTKDKKQKTEKAKKEKKNSKKQQTFVNPRNPIIWADVPDPSTIRVGDTYYMSSTTMHMNPGVPIMKSKDLVNWEIVNYAYDILADNDVLSLRNGKETYGRGSWASSLRHHNGEFY